MSKPYMHIVENIDKLEAVHDANFQTVLTAVRLFPELGIESSIQLFYVLGKCFATERYSQLP